MDPGQPQLRLTNRQSDASSDAPGRGILAVVSSPPSKWSRRYGRRHAYQRLPDQLGLKDGRRGRVTIYQRGSESDTAGNFRFVLSWSAQGKRRKETFIGDVFAAVARADEINDDVASHRTQHDVRRCALSELVEHFVAELHQRAAAGDLAPATPQRYASALRHLLDLENDTNGAWMPTRDWALELKARLNGKLIASNGHPNTTKRSLRQSGVAYILATAAALIRWAVERERLPATALAVVPHLHQRRKPTRVTNPVPITHEQLNLLFAAAESPAELLPIALIAYHGLRPSEAAWLMAERIDFEGGWITYGGIEELGHRTKGNVEKRLPIPEHLRQLLESVLGDRRTGPVLLRATGPNLHADHRSPCAPRHSPSPRRSSGRRRTGGSTRATGPRRRDVPPLAALCARVRADAPNSWSARHAAGKRALLAAGGVDGDHLRRLFRRLARRAGLPRAITPKALRHLFATTLEQAGVGYYTRRYMLGHAVSERGRRDATAVYTHVDDGNVRRAFESTLVCP